MRKDTKDNWKFPNKKKIYYKKSEVVLNLHRIQKYI